MNKTSSRLDEKLTGLLFAAWVLAALVAGIDSSRAPAGAALTASAQAVPAVARAPSSGVTIASAR